MTASRIAVSTANKILGSAKLPDFSRILPPDAVFASAQKSGFLKCNRVEATTVLSAIWQTTQQSMQGNYALQQQQAASVANICAAHNFSPSNFTSLALLLQQSPPTANTKSLPTDLLSLAELLNDPPAILKSAKSKISSSRSIPLLESTQIWKKLLYLANTSNIPEAHELIAETYQNAKSIQKAQEYWTKAAEAGSGKACLVMGRQAIVIGKKDVAVHAFERAKELGEAEAYYELGILQIKDGDDGDNKARKGEAEYNLSVAAASGIVRAAVKLAELCKSRNDLVMAEQWENVASEMKAIE
ncbi:hypothetical protein AOL_s00043g569 [Orbilia oligospora ATCC 24927]|uniref:Uncharacterized protein n=1 Tax=Arthrobotrys oligospora (strain ATCC 24927 / CBS 115.81 / DSM 1491) TaxID=756982 RepID=G1X4E5_ARTOA|nr:hypothetical protein AOL_s00043g569 [Orbilia oligospora ATCC 24927]EGX51835.1 hypothetical protein AOL_s00043g569 [Orbilia oligospora ATCC 24927]